MSWLSLPILFVRALPEAWRIALRRERSRSWSDEERTIARFRTIYENAPFMINSFDQAGKAVLWNRAATEQLGYTQLEVNEAGDSFELFYPDSELRRQVMHTIANPDGKFREFKVRRKDGVYVYQMWANFTLPDQSLISVGYDVTGMREAREQLRLSNHTLEEKVAARTRELDEQRAKLVFASKYVALGEMAGGVAHEINNPLAIIAGYAAQLQEMLNHSAFDKATFEGMLGSIRSAVGRITKIVSGLRNISRDGSRDPLTECRMNDLLFEVLGLCGERFRIHGVELLFEGEELGTLVLCRPVELQQVILNLLTNAFDAVQNIPCRWVKLTFTELENEVCVSVSDSGPGVPAEVREKIFQPFFTTKPIGKGTGLGLSISKGIAEAHRGTLAMELDAGETCFVLKLPKLRP